MSLASIVREDNKDNKKLRLTRNNGKYSIKYESNNQKFNMKSEIEDGGYANYLYDLLLSDLGIN